MLLDTQGISSQDRETYRQMLIDWVESGQTPDTQQRMAISFAVGKTAEQLQADFSAMQSVRGTVDRSGRIEQIQDAIHRAERLKASTLEKNNTQIAEIEKKAREEIAVLLAEIEAAEQRAQERRAALRQHSELQQMEMRLLGDHQDPEIVSQIRALEQRRSGLQQSIDTKYQARRQSLNTKNSEGQPTTYQEDTIRELAEAYQDRDDLSSYGRQDAERYAGAVSTIDAIDREIAGYESEQRQLETQIEELNNKLRDWKNVRLF